ncbi:TPA: hypothetical protein DDZ01_03325 [Candidatus Uhrbacteria bacterium]|nr:MAG: hypothetical protein UT94_C0002G0003 [Candidatus Uhrbacteria bacterium GW2011_GWF2_40_263]OGL97410.1 MAG: hypothetical protein A2332_04810 [Candidatus Uhrbacteria bacterium RIFOXYB2_FULL_41_18]HBK34999.1 hypothetical protein [Candidatus Uhrbacteria bacterium]HCB56153.1 hypothetical protein [Candidatus Uhrbacteria bacterium]
MPRQSYFPRPSIFTRYGRAANFLPHDFEQKAEMLRRPPLPLIRISPEALRDMYIFVDQGKEEIGWLGTVTREGNVFLIEEVFLPEQKVHMARALITVDGLSKLTMDLLENRPEDGVEVINNLRFWGHSHVNGMTTPSGQDDRQMDQFKGNGCEWFIRGIFNKHGRMQFSIFFYDEGYVVHDVRWEIAQPVDTKREADLKKAISERVKPFGIGEALFDDGSFPEDSPFDLSQYGAHGPQEPGILSKALAIVVPPRREQS